LNNMLFKLFWADFKMLFRNRQSLFWSLAFPLMFTLIFGFFFGQGSNQSGRIALINHSDSELAKNIEKAARDSTLFKISEEKDIDRARDLLHKSEITAIISIPKDFGRLNPRSPKTIKVVYDPANLQSNMVVLNFVNSYLTEANFKVQKTKKIFQIEEEKTNTRNLTYFDFVVIGLIGMALMNSSTQGVSISMAKYREDKILKRVMTTPLKPWVFISAEILSRLILNLFQVAFILAISIYLFGAHIYGSIFLVFLFSLLGAVLFQSLGFAVASLTKTTDAAQGMTLSITIPMMFLAGVFFPIDQLPSWLAAVVRYLPLAPLLRMIRQIALEDSSPFLEPANMAIVVAWIIVLLVISSLRFKITEE